MAYKNISPDELRAAYEAYEVLKRFENTYGIKVSNFSNSNEQETLEPGNVSVTNMGHLSLVDSIKSYIKQLNGGDFTVSTVAESLSIPITKRPSVSIALYKLGKDGFIQLVRKGSGRIPNIYKENR